MRSATKAICLFPDCWLPAWAKNKFPAIEAYGVRISRVGRRRMSEILQKFGNEKRGYQSSRCDLQQIVSRGLVGGIILGWLSRVESRNMQVFDLHHGW